MLFKQLIAFSAIILVLAGCSDQPMQEGGTTPPSKGDNTNGVNNSTPGAGDNNSADSGSQPPSVTDPTSGNDNSPITPPAVSSLSRKSLTISGSVSGSQAKDTYAFKACVGQVCDSWQQVMPERMSEGMYQGMYQRKFHLSQWSTNLPLTIEGNKQANPASRPEDAIDALSSSYFKTEVAPFEQLIKRDSNNDGMVDEKELATLSLNSVNMAFHAVAKHLLRTKLSNFNQLPYESKAQAVRQYLSNNNKSQLKLTDTQKHQIVTHIEDQSGKITGNYSLLLTPEQWAEIQAPRHTLDEEKIIKINTSQLNEVYDKRYFRDHISLSLSVNQTNSIHKEQIYNHQLVLELAALYQMLRDGKSTDITLGFNDKNELIKKIEALTETQSYRIPISSNKLKEMGLFDIPEGKEQVFEVSIDSVHQTYEKIEKVPYWKWSADFTFTLEQEPWPKLGQSFEKVSEQLLKSADSNSSLELWQHFQNEFATSHRSVPLYQELSKALSPDTQKSYLYQTYIKKLQNINHEHSLKPAILAIAPERRLQISGRFPKELEQASLSVILGSRPEDPDLDAAGKYPVRHQPVELIDTKDQRHKELNLSGKNSFVTTIALRDINNQFSHCKPGLVGDSDYTADEMQDTLTIHIRDEKTGVELRSVLGSFCEISLLDQEQGNNNGVLTFEEFERLNVGYISTAQAALLFKSSLTKEGGTSAIVPLKHQEITNKYKQMPREQVEILAAFMALQGNGTLFDSSVDLGERGTLYDDLLALLDINIGQITPNGTNILPSPEHLQTKISDVYAIENVLLENPDVNISHIIQAITQRLGDSEVDQYYFPKGTRPGNWVRVHPVSSFDITCLNTMNESQLVGLRIDGKGQDEAGYWVTIGWDEQAGASSYTLGWGDSRFDQIIEAQNVLAINEYGRTRATVSGLAFDKQYYIRVQSDTGSPSALMPYSPQKIHVADSRVVDGLSGDDSSRGRDSSSDCDTLTGKAENNDDDGVLGARYLKLDSTGKPLSRQNLSYRTLPFSCVLDAHTGLVWETKHQRGEDEDPTIYDSDNKFVIEPANGATQFGGTCTVHETGQVSTDPNQCTVAKQIETFNSVKRCGLNNWRMPTFHEAHTLIDFSYEYSRMNTAPPGIDHAFFPHVSTMWLDSPNLDNSGYLALFLRNLNTTHIATSQPIPLTLVSDGFYVEHQ